MTTLAIKIDVDTDRGTRIGVPNMLQLFKELQIPATFLFSLGPDNTGRAIKRIFRPGFLKKVSRSNVVAMYGLRTLLNGVLLPGPHIGKRNETVMRRTHAEGHEVGIHCYDHIRWQDGLAKMNKEEVFKEFGKALTEFKRIFNFPAKTAGAAGWQSNAFSLAAYDDANLLYGSDARGTHPFFPRVNGEIFKTLHIPTTLPSYYLSLLKHDKPNIFTTHAEIEGMRYLDWFREFLIAAKKQNVNIVTMATIADQYLAQPEQIPVCEFIQGTVEGRSGTLAVQIN